MPASESPDAGTRPYRVGLLLIDGFALMSFASAAEPLRAANLIGGAALYDSLCLAAAGATVASSSGAQVPATPLHAAPDNLDLVLVVAGGDPLSFRSPAVVRWLRRQADRRVRLGGVSGGPAILARAGLMENRRLTIHWEHAAALAEHHPGLLLERSLFVIDRDRMTCAGGTAPLDMMHALIAGHHGAAFARRVSDWFMHTDIRTAGAPQRSGLVERYGIHDRPVLTAIEAMENHLSDPLQLDQIAAIAGLSGRQLNRLFATRLQAPAMRFYRDLRLDKAHNLLTQSGLPLTEIALATGFANSAHFSRCYRARFGVPPSSVRG